MIINANTHRLPEVLFKEEKLLNSFIDCVSRAFGENAVQLFNI
jgi:hypothetical protein